MLLERFPMSLAQIEKFRYTAKIIFIEAARNLIEIAPPLSHLAENLRQGCHIRARRMAMPAGALRLTKQRTDIGAEAHTRCLGLFFGSSAKGRRAAAWRNKGGARILRGPRPE